MAWGLRYSNMGVGIFNLLNRKVKECQNSWLGFQEVLNRSQLSRAGSDEQLALVFSKLDMILYPMYFHNIEERLHSVQDFPGCVSCGAGCNIVSDSDYICDSS